MDGKNKLGRPYGKWIDDIEVLCGALACTHVETVAGDSRVVSVGTMLNQSGLWSGYAIILAPPAPRCAAAVTDDDDEGGVDNVRRW